MLDRLRIGIITSTHGLKGELKVLPTTDDISVFDKVKDVILINDKVEKKYQINSVKNTFKGQLIISLIGLESIDDAEKLKKYEIWVDRKKMPQLNENENYVGDLLDLKAYTDNGIFLGVVEDYIETGANLVLTIRNEEKVILVPYISDCIKDVKLDEGIIVIHLLDGLLDL